MQRRLAECPLRSKRAALGHFQPRAALGLPIVRHIVVDTNAEPVAVARDRRHRWGMPVRRSADQTPDLFSAPPPARPSDPMVVRKAAPPANEQKASEPRHLLPKDLARSLMRLDDAEIDLLLSAVTTEAQRRGRVT